MDTNKMIKIKLTIPGDSQLDRENILKQTPNMSGIFEDFQFFINEKIEEYDYWVIFEGLPKEESIYCPKENILFLTAEPSSVKNYNKKFLNQFPKIITSQDRIKTLGTYYVSSGQSWRTKKSYDELYNHNDVKKSKIISIITSNKTFTPGHKKRLEFCLKLKKYFGDKIDIYGRGINDFDNKWDVLAPYKYSIAIENSVEKDYLTEKIGDCFTSLTFPFYYGCPNIDKYYEKNSYELIDINNFEKSCNIIEKIINDEKHYSNHLNSLIKSKNEYINKHNMLPLIVTYIKKDYIKNKMKEKITIKTEEEFRKKRYIILLLKKIYNLIFRSLKKIYKLLNRAKNYIKSINMNRVALMEFNAFKKKSNRFEMNWDDKFLIFSDKTTETFFDAHYIYHPAWAARILSKTKPIKHTDISSTLNFSTMLSAFIPVEFYDYRPANIKLSNLTSGKADLTSLPFADNSIESLSCMHTVEHIGLGRYGDPIDPDGDIKAIKELSRVLAKDGNLLFVVPIGKPRIQFNAHRIYSYDQIVKLFPDLTLKEFSLIPDNGYNVGIIDNASEKESDKQKYGCGCFWFIK